MLNKLLLLLLLMTATPSWSDASLLPSQSALPTKLTENQALKIASDFCQRIGQPVIQVRTTQSQPHTPATAAISGRINRQAEARPMSLDDPLTGDRFDFLRHWQPRWRVRFLNPTRTSEVDMEVADRTGDICYYFKDDATPISPQSRIPIKDRQLITRQEAIVKATAALTNAGAFKTGDLEFKEAFLDQGSVDSAVWFVSWTRKIQGIPYRYQGANVNVDAVTGEVKGFSVNFPTQAPMQTALSVSRDQAERIASQQMATAGIAAGAPSRVQSEVVQPNTFWQPGGNEDSLPYARVAWTLSFPTDSQSVPGRLYEVWVDAGTGAVIGGRSIGLRGNMALSGEAFRKPAGSLAQTAKPNALPKK